MLKRIAAAAVVVLVLLAALLAAGNSPPPRVATPQIASRVAKHVLVISLDGLDARYLSKSDEYGLKIPTLRRLISEGVVARGVVSVYPSVTYPAHTTMVTGTLPRRHGIWGNQLFESPDMPQTRGWHWFARDIRVDTLWSAAARRGFTTGMVSWPVGGGAGDYNVPEILKPGGTFQESAAMMATHARPQGLMEEVARRDPALYSRVTKDEQDDMRTRFAEYIIAEKRPALMLVHLFDLDHYEHDYGPFTPEAFALLEKSDGYVARLLQAAARAGTLSDTAVFIVSDHGFKSITKQFHPGVVLARAGLLKTREEKDQSGTSRVAVAEWRAVPYASGGACAIILRNPSDRDALNRARAAFKQYTVGADKAIMRVLEKEEIEKLGANPQAALMLEAAEGFSFGNSYTGEVITSTRQRGTHGYLPTRPDYFASLIVSGAGVTRRGAIPEVRMIDIGPTIARMLDLTLRDATGQALRLQ